jgi:hypothetical protein
MNKAVLIAAIVTPVVAAGAGFMIARTTSASAVDPGHYCVGPTVYVDMAEGVSMVTAGPDSNAACDGPSCTVTGEEQVQINADGAVRCVTVNAGQSVSLTRQSDGSVSVEEIAVR